MIITIVQWPGSGAAGAPSLPSTSIISKTRSKSSARTTTSKSSSALSGDYHDDQYDHDLMAINDQYDHDLTANFPCTGLWSVHSSPAKPLKPVEWGSGEASGTEATPQEKVRMMRTVVVLVVVVWRWCWCWWWWCWCWWQWWMVIIQRRICEDGKPEDMSWGKVIY